jgi:hypothetical protein
VRTLIDELGTECQNIIYLIHQLQLPDLIYRQKAEILAEFMSAAIQMNVHCGEDFQTLIAEEMEWFDGVYPECFRRAHQPLMMTKRNEACKLDVCNLV